MDTNKLMLPLAALMLACTPLAGADVPDADGICDGDEPPAVQCEVIAGPASLTIKSVVSVGIGFCQTETTDVPLQCEGNAGDINGAGAATFDASAFGTEFRAIDINVRYDQETCTAATQPPCGFTADICNDRDTDSTCTNIGDQDDELFDTASSEGVVYSATNGTSGECKDQTKGCDDPNEAGWSGCMSASVFSDPSIPDWNWFNDQIIVFIGVEAGPNIDPPDVQAAVSAGTYTVWFEDNGGGCAQGEDPNPSSGCIWLRTPDAIVDFDPLFAGVDALLDDPANTTTDEVNDTIDGAIATATSVTPILGATETCDDDGGNPINFECEGGAFVVVFHIGLGSTSATPHDCDDPAATNPQTASVTGLTPVNVQAIVDDTETFQCTFTWMVAGAGGCITV